MIQLPFQPLIDSMVKLGMEEYGAIMRVQSRLDMFVDEKSRQIQRFDIESNDTARLSTTALITLATVLLPLVGLVFSQERLLVLLSDVQRWLVVLIISLLFLSILFGVFSHWASVAFFKKWANGSQSALKYSSDSSDGMRTTKELYDKFDERMVHLGLINKSKSGTMSSTRLWDYLQFASVLLAGIFLVMTVYSLLFDVPFWSN